MSFTVKTTIKVSIEFVDENITDEEKGMLQLKFQAVANIINENMPEVLLNAAKIL